MHKGIYLFIILFLLTSACQKEAMHSVSTCTDNPQSDANIQEIADKYTALGIPGVAIIVQKGDAPMQAVYSGFASLGEQVPVGACHHFHSASLAKTYFAALTLKLAEQGKIDLNSTIGDHLTGDYLEAVDQFKEVQIAQLLDHSSGIPSFYTINHILRYFDDFDRIFSHLEMLEFIKGKDFDFESGTEVRYSDTNYLLIALILDTIVEGKTHIDLVYEELLTPLGLADTYYDVAVNFPDQSVLVNCYNDYYGDGNLQNVTELERQFAEMNIGHDSFIAKPIDYFHFFHQLMTGQYLSDASLEQMLTFIPYKLSFALHQAEGMGIRRTMHESNEAIRIGHFGATVGSANTMLYYPSHDVYLVVCANFGRYFDGKVTELFTTKFEDFGVTGNLIGDLEAYLLQ